MEKLTKDIEDMRDKVEEHDRKVLDDFQIVGLSKSKFLGSVCRACLNVF